MPDKAKLHEQKAQVLLELGDTWNALKAATRMKMLSLIYVDNFSFFYDERVHGLEVGFHYVV